MTRRLLPTLAGRAALALGVLLVSGLLAATLVRTAPGFGMDERLLDARFSQDSLASIQQQAGGQSNVIVYYWNYLRHLAAGDLGMSSSLGRPVRELLSERTAVSFRSAIAALLLAWLAAGVSV